METKVFSGAWIWENCENRKDEYVEFYASFTAIKGRSAFAKISASSDYELFINGQKTGFGQYPDYPHFKAYDRYDIADLLKEGDNHFAVRAYYSGAPSSTHYPCQSGLIFEIQSEDEVLLKSDEKVRSRLSRVYRSHKEKWVSGQMGYSYAADVSQADLWTVGEGANFHDSVVVKGLATAFTPRPVKRLQVGDFINGKSVKTEQGYWLYDLGREEVIYPTFTIKTENRSNVRLSWGEHILDGKVRRKIHSRDFSVDVTFPAGESRFTSTFLRLGARYLQIESDATMEVLQAGGYPVRYPVTVRPYRARTPLRQKIYDTAVRTLELCMHDHYEDCPWREQAMYAMDSRNQMLCGYFAFREYDFARACLELMCNDPVSDGLLTICYPCKNDLKIPSFSLHWFTAMREYAEYSGDYSLCERYWDKMTEIIHTFSAQKEGELLVNFHGNKSHWNFYEWSDGLEGYIFKEQEKRYELPLNCLYSLALRHLDFIAKKLGRTTEYYEESTKLNREIFHAFYDKERGAFTDFVGESHYSELGNALAVLCGAAEEVQEGICARLAKKDNGFEAASLSMAAFVYDALLKTNKAEYASFVLQDIDEKYEKMLKMGATSFWETLLGAEDFGGAGSLCHGWSAMPVYYYQLLEKGV